mgnify:CR=1 FL=1|tara:strand:- start:206 stop:1537 length:1332 start_codon:yes stop_codon:yes gene_type:complete
MNIVVVGSGSAGLLSALILKHKMPLSKVSIIRDINTKVIGVGESTFGTFIDILHNHLGIDLDEFVKYVKPVTKYGVLFKFGKKDFVYSFQSLFDYQHNNNEYPNGFYFDGGDYGHSEHSKYILKREHREPSGAVHIDNKLFLNYLEKLAVQRGIIFINDNISSIEREGDIIISLNEKYHADYFIDCSGFKPILSKEKFHSYEDILVNDRALFFRTKTKQKIRPYTQSSTMNCGWLWEIDHSQGYTGNGYVYSSKYITDEEAHKEVEEKLRIKIPDDSRVIKFKTGRLEKHWVGNVITIGNADGFIEPLEATSLAIILHLAIYTADIIRYGDKKGDLIDRFNIHANEYYDNIRDFILIHFCFNNKKNTRYWKDYKKRVTKLPKDSIGYDILQFYLVNNTHVKFMSHVFKVTNPFGLEGWYSILRGLIPTETDRKKWLVKLEKGG